MTTESLLSHGTTKLCVQVHEIKQYCNVTQDADNHTFQNFLIINKKYADLNGLLMDNNFVQAVTTTNFTFGT